MEQIRGQLGAFKKKIPTNLPYQLKLLRAATDLNKVTTENKSVMLAYFHELVSDHQCSDRFRRFK
jgi:hypothetical protein